jgi:hypothetical protein
VIDLLTRFDTSPQFVEALLQCHQKDLNPQVGMLCGEFEGRLFFEVYAREWVVLTVYDYAGGLGFAFSDDMHSVYSAVQQWQGLDYALQLFDRCILWHSTSDIPLPGIEWVPQ